MSMLSLNRPPVNAFDCVVIAMLVFGVIRGRKNGMSEEFMNLLKWLAVVIACAAFYQPAGEWFARSSSFSLLASFLFVYAGAALLILSLFAFIKYHLGGKLVGSDVFGRAEYYLGMGSGAVRCFCVLMAALALLNARYYSPAEALAMERFQNEAYGSNYFPTWHSAQRTVFEKSFAGSLIKQHLGFLLIKPTEHEDKQYHQREAMVP
jgi:uncharacterized membrane protein required for colicin V production